MNLYEMVKNVEGEFSSSDAQELAEVLSNKSVMRALKYVLVLADAGDKLTSYDFTGAQGLNTALQGQGRINGLREAVNHIINLAEMKK